MHQQSLNFLEIYWCYPRKEMIRKEERLYIHLLRGLKVSLRVVSNGKWTLHWGDFTTTYWNRE